MAEIKGLAPAQSREGNIIDNKTLLIGVVLVLGVIAGLASSILPVSVVSGLIFGSALFFLIYRNIQTGIVLYLIFNLILPAAGPSLDLGIQTPVGERGLHFNIHEIIMAMVLLAWIIQILMKKANWKERSPLIWPVLAYVLYNIFACFLAYVHGGRLLIIVFRFARTTLFFYIFFVVLNNVKSRKQFRQLIIISLVCATLVATFGLMQWVFGEGWAETVNTKVLDRVGYPKQINYVSGESVGQTYRVNSTFAHPNVLGAYLVFFLPFFVSMLWATKKFFARALVFLGLVLNLACLFFTGSRASWVAAGAIALAFAVFGLLDRRLVLAFAVIALLIILIFVMINPPEFVKIRISGYGAQRATQIRRYIYQVALDLFWQRPFFGLGEGMIGYDFKMGNFREMWGGVESVYLTLLVSHGAVGVFLFLLMYFFYWGMLLPVRRKLKEDPFLRHTAEALMLGMVGYAVSSAFGAYFLFAIPMLTLWWFYLGMGAVLYNIAKVEHGKPLWQKPLFAPA